MSQSSIAMKTAEIVKTLETVSEETIVMVMTGILILAALFLTFNYAYLNIKINDLQNFITTNTSLGKIYKPGEVNKVNNSDYEKLLLIALDTLRKNTDLILGTDFYGKDINNKLVIFPGYIEVLRFVKYDIEFDNKDIMNQVLEKNYGKNYQKSDKIVVQRNIQVNNFETMNYNHSLLTDLALAKVIYKKNKDYIDKQLQATQK